jgi:peptidyl-tRNA hydrolase
LADYVLGAVGKREGETIRSQFSAMQACIETWVREGNKGALDVQSRKA